MLFKLGISISLLGFLGIGILLLTNHAGAALQVGNYFFFGLLGVSIFGLVKNEN